MTGRGSVPPGIATSTSTSIVRVRIGTAAIRARFGEERPPVLADDWDEAAYVDERRRLYAQALEGVGVIGSSTIQADGEPSAGYPGRLLASCSHTGDRIDIEPGEAGHAGDADTPPATGADDAIAAAVQRVLADRHGWRRHLSPAWFERHRAWRARVGSPIQH